MTEPRLPVLPRIGFALLTIIFLLTLAVFVLLFFVASDERWNFLVPIAGMLFGLSWVRGARRKWIDRRRTADAVPAGPDGSTPLSAPEA
ncbi:hypothetical protein [Cellulomonas sp. URHE0023]|uniref:hypothetical protein n=1 Tax=Cellulomonas sp. URHE0023 TaxID=1380354 RepID=UPI00054D8DFF|nr:hypothetical protein [Cellulomonas sp. URHE0023]